MAALTPDDWEMFCALATRQRVAGLVASLGGASIPADARTALKARARASLIRVFEYRRELSRLEAFLAPDAIPVMALKGIHLGTSVYPTMALRDMSDVDVLVQPEHLDRVAAALLAQGFVSMRPTDPGGAAVVQHHLPRFIKNHLGVEVHWRLAAQGRPPIADPTDLWRRAKPSVIGRHFRELCPEDALLHAAAHATVGHFFELGIRPLCDIRALVDKHGATIDWATVASRAAEWRCARGVAVALRLSQQLLGTQIPDCVFDHLAHTEPPRHVLDAAANLIFAKSTAGVSEPAGRLVAVPTIRGRLRYAMSRVTLSQPHLAVLYPQSSRRSRWMSVWLPMRRLFDLTRTYAVSLPGLVLHPASDTRKAVDHRNSVAAWLRDE